MPDHDKERKQEGMPWTVPINIICHRKIWVDIIYRIKLFDIFLAPLRRVLSSFLFRIITVFSVKTCCYSFRCRKWNALGFLKWYNREPKMPYIFIKIDHYFNCNFIAIHFIISFCCVKCLRDCCYWSILNIPAKLFWLNPEGDFLNFWKYELSPSYLNFRSIAPVKKEKYMLL